MENRPISRRQFLKTSGLILGGSALVVTGAGCAAQSSDPVIVETPSFQYGNDSVMDQRILVAYATRTGSSMGVASAIGETLANRGFRVDVKPIKDNPALDGYQAVVLGSAINGGQWLPEAVEYVKNRQEALNRVKVALFCVHIMNLGEDETSRKNRLAYLDAVRSLVKPVDEAFFAGMGMKPDEQSALVRWAYRTFKIGPEGDCRDWTKIRGWAKTAAI